MLRLRNTHFSRLWRASSNAITYVIGAYLGTGQEDELTYAPSLWRLVAARSNSSGKGIGNVTFASIEIRANLGVLMRRLPYACTDCFSGADCFSGVYVVTALCNHRTSGKSVIVDFGALLGAVFSSCASSSTLSVTRSCRLSPYCPPTKTYYYTTPVASVVTGPRTTRCIYLSLIHI